MMLRPNPWKPDYVGAYTGPLDPIDALRNGANDRWEQVLFLLSEIGRDANDWVDWRNNPIGDSCFCLPHHRLLLYIFRWEVAKMTPQQMQAFRPEYYDRIKGHAVTQSVEQGLVEQVIADNRSLRAAGLALAEAALHVIRHYDGCHRLALAVAEWSKAVANEGGRGAGNGA